MFWVKPSSGVFVVKNPVELVLAVHGSWALQARVLVKTEAIGASFYKTVRVVL